MKLVLHWVDRARPDILVPIRWDAESADDVSDILVESDLGVYECGNVNITVEDLNADLQQEIERAIHEYSDFRGTKQILETCDMNDRLVYRGTIEWRIVPDDEDERAFLEDFGWRPEDGRAKNPASAVPPNLEMRTTRNRDGVVSVWVYDGDTRIGAVRAKRSKVEECDGDVADLKRRGFQGPTYVVARSHLDDAYRGIGLGSMMYERLFAALAKDGSVIVAPEACWTKGATSPQAMNVWRSLAKRYPSSNVVLAVGQKHPRQKPTKDAIRRFVKAKEAEKWVAWPTGGLADGRSIFDFDPKSVAKGLEVELEHTGDMEQAMRIAVDHLVEDPRYYEKLATIENPASASDVERFVRQLHKDHPLQNLWLTALDGGNAVRVDIIRVPADRRGEGHGDKVMSEITHWADRHDVTLVLTPSADWDAGNKARGKARLTRWYQRHGFVPNKGRRKDFRFTETMIRTPKTQGTTRTTGGRR